MRTLLAAAGVVGALLVSPALASGGAGFVAHSTLGLGPGGLTSSGNLTYHGGWVMRTNTTYAIYWVPSGFTCRATDPTCSNYESAINRYLKDVAAASGSDTNVYSVDTEYYDTTGPIAYQSTFGGWVVDHAPFPPYNPSSSCTDGTDPVCLTDQQVRAEIQNVITAVGWPDGESSLFVLMTPDSVGECFTNDNSFCIGQQSCADHGGFTGSDTQPVIYAFIPYAATNGCAGIPVNPSPNGDDADPAINLISHEQNEAITNPLGGGWYAGDPGHEIADLCAWNFGNPLGTAPNGQSYNEVINGHYYWLQQEWSNDDSMCLQRDVPGTLPPTNVGPPVVTGTAGVGKVLSTSAGTWSGNPTSYSYHWQRCTNPAQTSSCANIAGATAASYPLASEDAGFAVRSEVTAQNAAGASAPVASPATAVIEPVLVATTPPTVSGVAAVGRVLSVTDGKWNAAVNTVAYQWLRCGVDGSSCTSVPAATDATYVVANGDAGHTLEARVSATNVAGTAMVLSNRTEVVIPTLTDIRPPRIAGKPKVGRRLAASAGKWNGSPTSFRYQWLRCNTHGRTCRPIRRATRTTYVPRGADAGHKLRVRVTATNAAGPAIATSGPTRRVAR